MSARAFSLWKSLPLSERLAPLKGLMGLLKERSSLLASLITQEMGKPIVQAEYEIGKCVRGCDYYLTEAPHLLEPQALPSDARKSLVRYDPLGVILGIMPWNFPFWQVIRFAVPTLLAGNTVLLKHAPNVPRCALALEALFRDAGFPKGAFQSLFITKSVAARIIESPSLRGVSLTGSGRAGRAVAALAGKFLKKTLLELGGSDPLIVLSDANLDKCLPIAVQSRMLNTGQSCIAAKRIIVVQEIASPFVDRLVAEVKKLKVGDPMDRTTGIGPLARKDLRVHLTKQVQASIRQGARLLHGGHPLPGPGFFFEPTVLKIRPGCVAANEEIFGPVACVMIAKDEAQAIQMANQTPYGLGASLWTEDPERAERLIPQIEAGSVFVNGMVKSDPRLPFGGTKQSGYGRELSAAGIREFTNIKTVWIAP